MRPQRAVPGQAELAEGLAEVVPEQVVHPRHLPDFPILSSTPSCMQLQSVIRAPKVAS